VLNKEEEIARQMLELRRKLEELEVREQLQMQD
jgi:hypothetical protein